MLLLRLLLGSVRNTPPVSHALQLLGSQPDHSSWSAVAPTSFPTPLQEQMRNGDPEPQGGGCQNPSRRTEVNRSGVLSSQCSESAGLRLRRSFPFTFWGCPIMVCSLSGAMRCPQPCWDMLTVAVAGFRGRHIPDDDSAPLQPSLVRSKGVGDPYP